MDYYTTTKSNIWHGFNSTNDLTTLDLCYKLGFKNILFNINTRIGRSLQTQFTNIFHLILGHFVKVIEFRKL